MAEVARGEETLEADEDIEDGYHSVNNDWSSFFMEDGYLEKVKQLGLKGELRGCCFRSVCWKLYLGVLPDDYSKWIPQIKEKRAQYYSVKQEYLSDPRSRAAKQDATINNPLSLDTESPWNQYFQDEELKRAIIQDVDRTNPDLDFFQESRVKEMMSNVLFCYSRVHTDLSYRQGMHELLAPILFVLDSDKREESTVSANDSWAEDLLTILDPDHVEADGYNLFSALMETCSSWYEHGQAKSAKAGASIEDAQPFAEDDALPSSMVVSKLDRIQNRLLKKEDPELHTHLTKMAIQPQIYGIRWIRLLFAREYDLLDILVLWDALFAYNSTLDLIDHIAVAMLLYIRDTLLAGSYASVMQLLFNYPPVVDVHYMVKRALFLKDPQTFPRPPNWRLQYQDPLLAGTVPTTDPPAARVSRALPTVKMVTQGALNIAGKVTHATVSATVGRYRSKGKKPAAPSPATSKSQFFVSSPRDDGLSANAGRQEARSAVNGNEKGEPKDSYRGFEIVHSAAEKKLEKLRTMCQFCGDRMDGCLDTLEQMAVQEQDGNAETQNRFYLAIAGLKQVRDLLRGTLGFNLTPQELKQLLFSEEGDVHVNSDLASADQEFENHQLEKAAEPAAEPAAEKEAGKMEEEEASDPKASSALEEDLDPLTSSLVTVSP